MKQVIVRIRDVNGKLRAKEYYYCWPAYESYVVKFVRDNLTAGYEVQVKVGNQFSGFKTYEEFYEDAIYNGTDIDDEIFNWLLGSISSQKYWVKEYLPEF